MDLRFLDLDGGLIRQNKLRERFNAPVFRLQDWGPYIRMACSFGRFERFQKALAANLASAMDESPQLSLYGSGDFHHVSLAFLKRQPRPFNLLVLDNHPDWMRGLPFLHCGTWLYHAAHLPMVNQIFHFGGNVDFDNYYQWLAPWEFLRVGKIIVFPALRPFQKGSWATIPNYPLRKPDSNSLSPDALQKMIEPFRSQLGSLPLYISLDKDVMPVADAVVNWDSGHIPFEEVTQILKCFVRAAEGNMAGMDIVGDWSPVKVKGLLRQFFHCTQHPTLWVDATQASRRNAEINLALLEIIYQSKNAKYLQAG